MNDRTKILVDLALGIARSEKKEIREDDDTLDVHNLQQQPSTSTNNKFVQKNLIFSKEEKLWDHFTKWMLMEKMLFYLTQ